MARRKIKRRVLRLETAFLDSVKLVDCRFVLDFRLTEWKKGLIIEKHAYIGCSPSMLYGYARKIGEAVEARAKAARNDVESVARGFHDGIEIAK